MVSADLEELILLHLQDKPTAEKKLELPWDVSLAGISKAIGAKSSRVLETLNDLKDRGLIKEGEGEVRGKRRVRNIYFLTDEGVEKSERIRGELNEQSVKIKTEEGVKEIKLEDIDEFLDIKNPLLTVLSKETEEVLDLKELRSKEEDVFVGREEEMDKLQDNMERVKEDGARALFVAGEAGIGKTRLISELKPYALERGFDFLVGVCHSERADPYLPFKEAFSKYLEAEDIEEPTEATLMLMGDEMGPKAEDKKMFDAEREATFYETTKYVKNIAKENPLVVFIDDIQWADQASLEILGYMAEKIKDEPILFISTYRPEDVPKDHPLLDMTHRITSGEKADILELDPLKKEDTGRIIRSVVGREDIPEEHIGLIHKKTDGNPLFVKECIRHMMEEEVVDPKKGEYPTEAEEISIPKVVEEVIVRRINRLENEPKNVLEIGSVIGEEIPFKLLAEVSSVEEIDLLDYIDILSDNNLWRESPDEEVFYFYHELVRDTVYDRLRKVKQKVLHKEVAQKIEEVYQDSLNERYQELAQHYKKAKEQAKAIDFYKKAGEQAENVYAQEDAIEMYTQAIEVAMEISPDVSDISKTELLEKRGDAYKIIGDYDNAIEDFENAIEGSEENKKKADLYRKIAEVYEDEGAYEEGLEQCENGFELLGEELTSERVKLLNTKGRLNTRLGEYDTARDILERCVQRSEELGVKKEIAQANHDIATVFLRQGHYEKSIEYLEKALEIREEIEDLMGKSDTLNNMAVVYHNMGESDKGLDYYERSLEMSEKLGLKRGIAVSLGNMAIIYQEKGDSEKALDRYKEALKIYRKVGDEDGTALVLGNLGAAYHDRGELDKALDYYEEALEKDREIGDKHAIGIVLGNIGSTYIDQGDLDKAQEYLQESLRVRQEIGNKYGIVLALDGIGSVNKKRGEMEKAISHHEHALKIVREVGNKKGIGHQLTELAEDKLKIGEVEEAQEKADEALDIASETEAKSLQGFIRKLRGMIHREKGEFEKAEEELQKAEEIFKDFANIELPEVKYQEALLLKDRGEQEKAREVMNEALEAFKEIGMSLWVERCEEALEDM